MSVYDVLSNQHTLTSQGSLSAARDYLRTFSEVYVYHGTRLFMDELARYEGVISPMPSRSIARERLDAYLTRRDLLVDFAPDEPPLSTKVDAVLNPLEFFIASFCVLGPEALGYRTRQLFDEGMDAEQANQRLGFPLILRCRVPMTESLIDSILGSYCFPLTEIGYSDFAAYIDEMSDEWEELTYQSGSGVTFDCLRI